METAEGPRSMILRKGLVHETKHRLVVLRYVRCLDAPFLRIEVVGTVPNVFYQTKWVIHEAYLHQSARRVG